jgi:uncharacterized protein (TIGR02284 family)
MVTTVGKEKDTLELLKSLIELDYDAIEAYEAAIQRVDDPEDKAQLSLFKADHERHVKDLGDCVRQLGGTPPTKADLKAVLTKGKVVLMGLAGDRAVLMAMKSNEEDTNTAYERAMERNLPSPFAEVISKNLSDERRHRAWLMHRLGIREEVPQH